MKRLGKRVKPCEYILVAERAQEWFGSIKDFPSRTRSGKQVLIRLPCIFSGEQFAIVLKHSKAFRQYPLQGFRERFVEQKKYHRGCKAIILECQSLGVHSTGVQCISAACLPSCQVKLKGCDI